MRHVPGKHRAQPLVASWNPEAELGHDSGDSGEAERSRGRAGWLGRFAWRIYAVPVLVIVSAVVIFQTVEKPPAAPVMPASGGQVNAPDVPEAPVEEAPPGQTYNPKMFSADLPPGSPIPVTGAHTFDVMPGSAPPIGAGRLYKYTVEIETGVRLDEGNDTFANLVQQTLSDPRSWTNPKAKPGGIRLQRVDQDPSPDFRVTLVSQNTAREVCGFGNGLPFDTSCKISDPRGDGDRVYINAARWVRGAISFQGDQGAYRRYAINHEVGHVFGNGHVGCPAQGVLAPVMMQQTFSVSNNELHELNKSVPQGTEIPANGFVCKYNAWPFPIGDNGS